MALEHVGEVNHHLTATATVLGFERELNLDSASKKVP